MQAERDDLVGLLHLQQIDLEILKLQKKLDELPYRKAIEATHKKLKAIDEKRQKVQQLKKDASLRLSRISDEEEQLLQKEIDVQAAIDAAQGDYRNLEARTKELAGIAKRREALEEDRAEIKGQLAKITEVETQVQAAFDQLAKSEAEALAAYKSQAQELAGEMTHLTSQVVEIESELSPEVLQLYRRTAKQSGGVALGLLSENRCGVCRTPIEGGRLIDLKAQAPLGKCPSCGRLLIIG